MQTAVSETDCKAPARQLALTDNPGNIHKVIIYTTVSSWKFSCSDWQQVSPSQMFSGQDLQDYGCKSCKDNLDQLPLALKLPYAIIVSNPKVNLSEPLSLQFVCNQGSNQSQQPITAQHMPNMATLQKQNCYFSKLLGYYSCVKLHPKPVHLNKPHQPPTRYFMCTAFTWEGSVMPPTKYFMCTAFFEVAWEGSVMQLY